MSNPLPSSRRSFLKGAGLVGATSLLAANRVTAGTPPKAKRAGSAKNLIFLVADGMGMGTFSLANHWKLRNEQAELNWVDLYGHEGLAVSLQDTASASSPVTDSAAAATAWGSGHRVNNGSLNVATDGTEFTPIWTYAKRAGKRTGVVTTCRVTHATPAGFTANSPNRNAEDAIARQYLAREIDVILGGGSKHFDRAGEQGQRLLPDFKAKGYQVVDTQAALMEAKGSEPLLGLFSSSHIPYAVDRKNDPSMQQIPSLTEMFQAALSNLSGGDEGFVLQVEAGRVDHAGHVNDPAAILHEMLEFDACIPLALEFIKNNPDTLLIVTTDHGTGGCQLNGEGKRYVDSGPALERINGFTGSLEALEKQFLKTGQFDRDVFNSVTGLEVTLEQATEIQAVIDSGVKYLAGKMADVVAAELGQKTAVGWSTHNHTSEHVPLLALGPGSEAIPALIQNNQLFSYMMQALGLKPA